MTAKPLAMRDALLAEIWRAMASDEKLFFVTADFGSPQLDKIRADFPERFVNVGVAEQNLINVTAGLALEGFVVFAYAIAPFITMRCFEQLRVSIALLSEVRQMNVNLIGVGAGYSYTVSGPTHQCYEDITLMRALPNFRVLSPADHVTAGRLLDLCMRHTGPKYIRLDAQVLPTIYSEGSDKPNLELGFTNLQRGTKICIISTGYMSHIAKQVAEDLAVKGIKVTLIDLFDITNFDQVLLIKLLRKHKGLVTVEEGFRGRGGVDAQFFQLIARNNLDVKLLNIGVEPGYNFELGTRSELHERAGLGKTALFNAVQKFNDSL